MIEGKTPFEPSSERGTPRPPPIVLGGILVLLIVVGLIVLKSQPEGHLARIFCTFGALFVGMTGAFGPSRVRSLGVRLFGLSLGILLAMAAWWFVPTASGLSLWAAHQETSRQVGEFALLPSRAIDLAKGLHESRQGLVVTFPQFRGPLEEAEANWGDRAVADVLKRNERWLSTDPERILGNLAYLNRQLEFVEKSEAIQSRLLSARREAVRACFEVYIRQAPILVAANDFERLYAILERVEISVREDAQKLGMGDELAQFRESCGFLADLARMAKKPDPK